MAVKLSVTSSEMINSTRTMYTNSPKILKFFDKNYDCLETGVYYSGHSTISVITDTNNEPSLNSIEKYHPCNNPLDTISQYKKAIKVLKMEEIEEAKLEKRLWQYYKDNALNYDKDSYLFAILMALLCARYSPMGIIAPITILALNLDIIETYEILNTLLKNPNKKEKMHDELLESPLSNILLVRPKVSDTLMYAKVKK